MEFGSARIQLYQSGHHHSNPLRQTSSAPRPLDPSVGCGVGCAVGCAVRFVLPVLLVACNSHCHSHSAVSHVQHHNVQHHNVQYHNVQYHNVQYHRRRSLALGLGLGLVSPPQIVGVRVRVRVRVTAADRWQHCRRLGGQLSASRTQDLPKDLLDNLWQSLLDAWL